MSLISFVAFTASILVTCIQLNVMTMEEPHLISTRSCLEACGFRGGFCGGFCGEEGYCCRREFGECLESYERIATTTHHSCVKGELGATQHPGEHPEGGHFANCHVDVLHGQLYIESLRTGPVELSKVLGELDVLPEEYGFTFNIQPLVNSTEITKYQLVVFDKDKPYLGGAFSVIGSHGIYHVRICGSLSGEVGGCTEYQTTHKVGEWIRGNVHQENDEDGVSILKVYVNKVLQKTVINMIPNTLRNVKVIMVVVPYVRDAGQIKDIYFGSCVSKFNSSETSAY